MKKLIIDIIDQQEDFIVINKSPGSNFHDEADLGSGLFNQVKAQLNLDELYPVHRLDKMTSGAIIFATNQNSARQFQQLFSQHKVEKYYLAISDKKPGKKQGLIKGDMIKSRRGSWKLLRTQLKPAITQFFSYAIGEGKRLYLVKPHSGKTHQIRVALSSIGAPIIGDSYYYPQITTTENQQEERGYLHAFAIKFVLNDECYQYIIPPNIGREYLTNTVKKKVATLTPPWSLIWPKI